MHKKKSQLSHSFIIASLMLFCLGWIYSSQNVRAATFEDTQTTIYGLSEYNSSKISIPDGYEVSYQIPYESGTTYTISEGDSVKVSSTGLVTAKYTYWKSSGSIQYSVPEGSSNYDHDSLNTGDSTIIVKNNGETYTYTITVKDYATVYCDQVIKTYLDENITEAMTDLEKMNVICRMPAMYDYGQYSSADYMILFECGNCWASTELIIRECEQLGIHAWARDGSNDTGAGSLHSNAMVEYNGTYYELEAGYSMSKTDGYRPYNVTVRSSLFSYRTSTQGLTIYQYDGDDDTGVLEIPDSIDGKTVIGIEEYAFAGNNFTEIILPNTLKNIGNFAFKNCTKLETLKIPASVSSIGKGAFYGCSSLNSWSVEDESTSYKVVDGVLYDADIKSLISCPNADHVTIPDTVENIGDYAFYKNTALNYIKIPSNVKEIQEDAFGYCQNLTKVQFDTDSVKTIADYAFEETGIVNITFPSSLSSIGAGIFYGASGINSVYFTGSAPDFDEKAFYETGHTIDAYYIPNDSWTEDALSDHGGTLNWISWEGTFGKSIGDADVTLSETSYTYDGTEKKPDITVTYDGTVLSEGADYSVAYSNNVDAGEAMVTITGTGSFDAQQNVRFTISKATQILSVTRKSSSIEIGETMTLVVNGAKTDVTYTSSDESILTVDENGNVTAVGEGTAYITITAIATDNYKSYYTTRSFTASADIHTMEVISYDEPESGTNIATLHKKCAVCGKTEDTEITVLTSFWPFWRSSTSTSSYYYSYVSKNQNEGTTLSYMFSSSYMKPTDATNKEITVTSSDPNVMEVTSNRNILIKKAGTATITFQVKYNPSVTYTYTFTVNHIYEEDADQMVESSCTQAGSRHYTCSYCGETKTEEIAALGHTEVTDESVAATCTETGLTEGSHCSVCNETLVKQDIIPATGHIWDEGTVTTAATCTEKGEMTYKCTACDATRTEDISATGHSWDTDYTVDQKPTCTETGLKSIHCANCDNTKDSEIIPATGHIWNDGTVTTAATCTEKGEMTYKCTACDATRTEDISATGHSWDTDYTVDQKPTCTETGLKSIHCANCDNTKDSESIPATGHIWDEGTVTTAATCTEKGVRTYKCTACDATRTEDISATGHSWDTDYTVDQKPTCTETGLKSIHCANCDNTKDSEVIPATGHIWDEGTVTTAATCTEKGVRTYKCTACDATRTEEIPAKGHFWNTSYTIDKEATCTNAGSKSIHCKNCNETKNKTVIPATIVTPNKAPSSNPVSQDKTGTIGQNVNVTNKKITSTKSDEISGAVYQLLQLRSKKIAKTFLTIQWKKVSGATSYVIYGAKCGSKFKKLGTLKSTSYTQKKLAKGTYYKYFVIAVKGSTTMATSKTIHLATSGGKVGNDKSIKLNKVSLSLAKGKKYTLKASLKPCSKKLKVKRHRAVAYESSNPSIATVSSKGIVSAKKKGTCYIFAYAQNGIFKSIKIRVK